MNRGTGVFPFGSWKCLGPPAARVALARQKAAFFSSRLADVAQRLGSYENKLSENICRRTQLVHKSRQIQFNQKTNQGQQPRRPANPPARFAFRQEKTANQNRSHLIPPQRVVTELPFFVCSWPFMIFCTL